MKSLEERAEAYESISDAELQKKRKAHEVLTQEKKKLEKKLKVQKKNPFLRAFGLFSLPFKAGAFEALGGAMLYLFFTFIFSVVACFVGLGAVLCVIADAVYCVLFVPFYPFAVLYLALFGKKSLARTQSRLAEVEKEIGMVDIVAVEKGVAARKERENKMHARESGHAESSSHTSTSGVESTDYYKSKKDEYYRQYMGFPPKDERPLSDLATDTALDIDVGDY